MRLIKSVFISSMLLFLVGFFSIRAQAIDRLAEVNTGIYRGAQPLTDQDFKTLQKLGIKTSINLRYDEASYLNEKDTAAKYGIEVVHFPLNSMIPPVETEIVEILRTMVDPSKQPVFVHCRYGKDRTGMVVGLYRIQKMGWTESKAYQEMLSFGYNPFLLPLDLFFLSHSHE